MLRHSGKSAAIFGFALIALSLTGSSRNAALSPTTVVSSASPRLAMQRAQAERLYNESRYAEARDLFLQVAQTAQAEGNTHTAAIGWNSAGGLSTILLEYRPALEYFFRARKIAEKAGDFMALSASLTNLATLYRTSGNAASALNAAREGLALPLAETTEAASIRAKLHSEEAISLATLGRLDEARPLFQQAGEALENLGDLTNAARLLGAYGIVSLNANHFEESENALSRALALVRIHRLNNAANILRGLGRLKARQGDTRSAALLFQAALDTPPATTPRWLIYADRGDFRLGISDWPGALKDFRESRRIAMQMRADVVPADQDRVALEGGLSRVAAGLVEAGNELAVRSKDLGLLDETFAAAAQDRLWSLRALIPEPNDWRTRLPAAYWNVLAGFQAAERVRLAKPAAAADQKASALRQQLEQMEAAAAGSGPAETAKPREAAGSEIRHIRKVLDRATVLFSFHIGKSSGWVWAVDRSSVSVYRIGDASALKTDAAALSAALQKGDADAKALGQKLYRNLFGEVANSYLAHSRWLLELDGPLFDVPFAALVTEDQYLASRVALEIVPSSLMLKPRQPFRSGDFLGVGDPIYNAADARYEGVQGKTEMALPRLPATAPELDACSREWGAKTRLLTGRHATASEVVSALGANPAVVHFATHVIAGPGEYSSGLIALSLNQSGSLGMMGPTEIVAHPVKSQLVVLNGCHSAQGEALPGAGLMGLTRAWIGAGAQAVLATRWDIPDDAGKAVMVAFYRALRLNPAGGPAGALQQAQMEVAADPKWSPAIWAAYFLLAQE